MNASHPLHQTTSQAESDASFSTGPPQPSQLRIAYLVSEYPALSHTFITREIAELEKLGHHVDRFSVRRPKSAAASEGCYEREFARTTYLLRELPQRFPIALARLAIRRPAGLLRALGLAAKIALRQVRRPHAVAAWFAEAVVLLDRMHDRELTHVHNHFGNAAGFVAMLAAETGEVDFSLSVHGPDIFNRVEEEMLGLKVEKSRFTRCISHFSRSQLCLLTDPQVWDRIEIARCGVDPDLFHPRERNPETVAIPRILCVGRLVPAKGQHLLLEASCRLLNRGLLHELILVGTGPDESTLRQRATELDAEEWVTFTGGLPPAEVMQLLSKADLFVLPSFAEGIPVALMEAMAMEVPVISTPVAGIPELIESGRSGSLVAPASIDSLTDAIGDFIERPDEWRSLAAAGRETVCTLYHQRLNGEAMVRLFESHLAEPS